jgi:hypothetical protein
MSLFGKFSLVIKGLNSIDLILNVANKWRILSFNVSMDNYEAVDAEFDNVPMNLSPTNLTFQIKK